MQSYRIQVPQEQKTTLRGGLVRLGGLVVMGALHIFLTQ